MEMLRAKVPEDWIPKMKANLPAVLVDHAHLERKAATTALNLEKFRQLFGQVHELNAIAIEELQHFQLVLEKDAHLLDPLVHIQLRESRVPVFPCRLKVGDDEVRER